MNTVIETLKQEIVWAKGRIGDRESAVLELIKDTDALQSSIAKELAFIEEREQAIAILEEAARPCTCPPSGESK